LGNVHTDVLNVTQVCLSPFFYVLVSHLLFAELFEKYFENTTPHVY